LEWKTTSRSKVAPHSWVAIVKKSGRFNKIPFDNSRWDNSPALKKGYVYWDSINTGKKELDLN
jgi:hypothetical protein